MRAALAVPALAVAALLAGCQVALPESGPAQIIVENDRPVEARVIVGGAGYYEMYSVPANSWAKLPGEWAMEYQIDDSCVVISASAFQPGGFALVRIEADGTHYVIDDRRFAPTIGPLSSPTRLNLCPDGPLGLIGPPSEGRE